MNKYSYVKDVLKRIFFKSKGFVLFSILFFSLIFTIENINGRFWLNDFKVYYSAANSLLEGKSVYGIPFGLNTGFYKYSPFILFLFIPLCLLPYSIASIIQFTIIFVSTITAVLIIQNIIDHYFFQTTNRRRSIILSIGLLCIVGHIVRELHMGNVNMILLLLLSIGLLFTLKSKDMLAGICIGLAIITKPYFLLLILPLLLHKKTKTVLSITATFIFSLGIPLIILGISKGMSLHQSWITAMLEHNSYITSNENFLSLINYYIYPGVPDYFQYFVLALVVSIYLSLFLYVRKVENKSSEKGKNEQVYFIMEYYTLLAIIPNMLLTDTEHFLFSLPIILLLLNYLFISQNYWLTGIFIILIFFYAGNSSDIVGHQLSDQLDEMGALGISNLLIILFTMYVVFKSRIFSRVLAHSILLDSSEFNK